MALDMAKGSYGLSLIENSYDTGFFKAMEDCKVEEDTIGAVESACNQATGAIASATKHAVQLPLVKNIKGLVSFKSALVPEKGHYSCDAAFRYYEALSRLSCITLISRE